LRRDKVPQTTGEQFVRPLTDVITDLEISLKVDITIEMRPTGRKGVLEVKMYSRRLEDPANGRPTVLVSHDWPSPEVGSLPAHLYRLAMMLGRLVEEDRRDMNMRGQLW